MTYTVNNIWRLTTTSTFALISSLIGTAVLGGTAQAQVSNLPPVTWAHSSETKVDKDLAEADIQLSLIHISEPTRPY